MVVKLGLLLGSYINFETLWFVIKTRGDHGLVWVGFVPNSDRLDFIG